MAFKIFPATLNSEKQKVPLIRGWNENASADPEQHKAWQNQFGTLLHFWGVPCGSANGIYALDIDVKKVNGWDSLKRLNLTLPETLRQDTPSGGSHLIFKTKPGQHYPNTVNTELGLDTRGDRGWIAYYGFKNNVPLADVPDWLLNLTPKSVAPLASGPTYKIASSIAEEALLTSLSAIVNAPEGESNNTLNTEAFKVGQLVIAGSYTREFVEAELFKAAKQRGKPDFEARATIRSGLDGGIKAPMLCPFDAPMAPMKLPSAPEPVARWTPRKLTRLDLLNTSQLRKPQLFEDWSTEDIHIVTADGGTGKTTLMLNEAIALALGDRFLGFENKQRGKTLFITGEDTDKKLAAMLGAILRQMGLFSEGLDHEEKIQCILDSIVIKKDDDLCLIAKDKQGFLFPNSSAFEKLMQAVEDIKPKMIVFDPIASFWGSESSLNDMNKVVTKFMGRLAELGICVVMVNHMGKSSSANKDMSQFAGRGGSGLPSNSRVSRVLRALPPEEFTELTGTHLEADDSAMLCNVNKFSDGSRLCNKPFVIVRTGYMFKRIALTVGKERELEQKLTDAERVFVFIKRARAQKKYPTQKVVIGEFMNCSEPLSEARIKRALVSLQYDGHLGEKITETQHPDLTIRDRALIIIDQDGVEIV